MKTLNKQIAKMLFAVLTLTLVFSNGIKTSAATNATISYDVTGELKKGNTVDIALNVKDATDIYGASWDLAYDKTLFEIVSITPGNVFPTTVNVPVKDLVAGSGQVQFATTLTGAAKAEKVTGTIATMKVKLLKDGKATLKTNDKNDALVANGINSRVKLAKTANLVSDIKYTSTDKTIVIGKDVPPEPSVSTLTSFKANKPSGQALGSTITLTAEATPSADTLYSFYVKEGSTWNKVTDFAPSNTFAWTPAKYGNYTLRVHAKHKNSTASSDSFKDIFYNIKNPATMVTISSFTSDKPSSQTLGTTIKFTVLTNATSNSHFEFYVYENGTWVKKQAFSATNSYSWKPTARGTYTIRVHAKHKNLTTTDGYKDMKFVIN